MLVYVHMCSAEKETTTRWLRGKAFGMRIVTLRVGARMYLNILMCVQC
jgi:hypothetical protein